MKSKKYRRFEGNPKYDTNNVIKHYYSKIPILGVCLGLQANFEVFGHLEHPEKNVEYVSRAKVGPMHGKLSKVFHDQETIFKGIPNPLVAVRYHSLAARSEILPQSLKITATADDGTVMAIRHKDFPIEGVQFHPESIKMKPYRMQILKNFLEL